MSVIIFGRIPDINIIAPSQAAPYGRRSPRAPWTISVADDHQGHLKTLRARTDRITPYPPPGGKGSHTFGMPLESRRPNNRHPIRNPSRGYRYPVSTRRLYLPDKVLPHGDNTPDQLPARLSHRLAILTLTLSLSSPVQILASRPTALIPVKETLQSPL